MKFQECLTNKLTYFTEHKKKIAGSWKAKEDTHTIKVDV